MEFSKCVVGSARARGGGAGRGGQGSHSRGRQLFSVRCDEKEAQEQRCATAAAEAQPNSRHAWCHLPPKYYTALDVNRMLCSALPQLVDFRRLPSILTNLDLLPQDLADKPTQ